MPSQFSTSVIQRVKPEEASEAARVLAESFQRNNLSIWIDPDPKTRHESETNLFNSLVSHCLSDTKSFIFRNETFDCVSIWAVKETKAQGCSEPSVARPQVLQLFKKIYAAAPPLPFIYLDFLGSKTGGTGAGSAMIKYGLNLADNLKFTNGVKMKVSLWTSNESNVKFYRKFGFQEYSVVTQDDMTVWWMVRE